MKNYQTLWIKYHPIKCAFPLWNNSLENHLWSSQPNKTKKKGKKKKEGIMASLKVCSAFLVILFVTSGAVMAVEDAEKIIKANNCKTNHWQCGKEIFKSIFRTGSVTDKCCGELMTMGKVCHDAFVQGNLKNPNYLNKSAIVIKSIQIWNTCASKTENSPSASPSAWQLGWILVLYQTIIKWCSICQWSGLNYSNNFKKQIKSYIIRFYSLSEYVCVYIYI